VFKATVEVNLKLADELMIATVIIIQFLMLIVYF